MIEIPRGKTFALCHTIDYLLIFPTFCTGGDLRTPHEGLANYRPRLRPILLVKRLYKATPINRAKIPMIMPTKKYPLLIESDRTAKIMTKKITMSVAAIRFFFIGTITIETYEQCLSIRDSKTHVNQKWNNQTSLCFTYSTIFCRSAMLQHVSTGSCDSN